MGDRLIQSFLGEELSRGNFQGGEISRQAQGLVGLVGFQTSELAQTFLLYSSPHPSNTTVRTAWFAPATTASTVSIDYLLDSVVGYPQEKTTQTLG